MLRIIMQKVFKSSLISVSSVSASCGSCYAFAALAMNEARVRIMTNNTQQPVFSTQDIVECSKYAQGTVNCAIFMCLNFKWFLHFKHLIHVPPWQTWTTDVSNRCRLNKKQWKSGICYEATLN